MRYYLHNNMPNTILDIKTRIQHAIYAFDNDISKNLSQAAILYDVPYKRLQT